jgi:hypothetical protein
MPVRVDGRTTKGILHLVLEGRVTDDEMASFYEAHNAAIDAFDGADYRVLCDIRALLPMSPTGAQWMERAKAYSASRSNFRGSAVLTSSAVVALQHERTSVSGGVRRTELITNSEEAAWAHLRQVMR